MTESEIIDIIAQEIMTAYDSKKNDPFILSLKSNTPRKELFKIIATPVLRKFKELYNIKE